MRYHKLVLIVLSVLGLNACGWFWDTASESEAVPTAPVQIVSGGLLSRNGTPELGLTLLNAGERTLWVSAHFQTPGGLTDCVQIKELESGAEQLYLCAQPRMQAHTDYRIRIEVFTDLAQSQLIDTLNTEFRFTQGDIDALGG